MTAMTRALDTLLSLTAADALGAATEFKTPEAIRARYGETFTDYQEGSVFGFAPGEATDDSQMVVATLLGYQRQEGLSGVLHALRDWQRAGPPDVGNLTRAALAFGTPTSAPLDGGVRAWAASGYQSAGNGGLMRIAAVWLAGFRGATLTRETVLVTALTHADPRCVFASVFFTAFLEALAAGEPYAAAARSALTVMDRCDARAALIGEGLLSADTLEAGRIFARSERDARGQVRAAVRAGLEGQVDSQSGYVLDTLQAALAHGQGKDWLACVQPAVLLGDDSDTVACVVGAVCGARGLNVPERLLVPLRLGHTWPGWAREWRCVEHFPALLP